jgi:hypothetical protein
MKNNNKTKFFFHALIVGAVLLGMGCQAPPLNFSPANIGLSKKRHPLELRSVSIKFAQPIDRKSRDKIDVVRLNYNGGINAVDVTTAWQNAIEDAVLRMGLFNDDSKKKVSILATINVFDFAAFGKLTVNTRYEIIDRSDNSILFYGDIETSAGDALNFWDNVNSGVQKNIMQFLQQLETADIDKPIFPGRKEPDKNP